MKKIISAVMEGATGVFLLLCLGCLQTAPRVVERIQEKERLVFLQPIDLPLIELIGEGRVSDFQYYISSEIRLEREYSDVESGPGENGAVKIINTYQREMIRIRKGTRGSVMQPLDEDQGKRSLLVCFDDKDESMTLRFTQTHKLGLFELEITGEAPRLSTSYGNKQYRIVLPGNQRPPHLLVEMQNVDDSRDDLPVLRGRSVAPRIEEVPGSSGDAGADGAR
ncbi:MAG: hypothetical protein LBC67_04985 [Spirochaetales bacterium]|jgi:hypothetical protein|nr:hypothetical protein [Spirochaetales bacterium]